MPRKRMINPNIWDDPEFIKLSDTARLLFIGLFSTPDDEGRLRGSPAYLKKTIFGYDDKKTPKKVEGWRNEIVKIMKNVILYRVNGEDYIFLKNWGKYQKQREDRIQRSELPAPTKENIVISEDTPTVDGQVADISPTSGGHLPAEVKGSEVKGSEDKLGEERGLGETPKPPTPKILMLEFIESCNSKNERYYKLIELLKKRGVPEPTAILEIQKFLNHWTELNQSGTKQLWQLKKTFEVNKRLATWFGNIGKWSNNKQKSKISERL